MADALDSDTRRTLSAGRETLGDIFGAARSKLRRVFIIFVIGLLGTVYAMRVWVWPTLERDLLALGADIVVITPFDVILLQAKIGIFVGIVLSIPAFLYYGREPLKRRGWYPEAGVATWKLAGIGLLAVLLFCGGIVYSYVVFFPIMFDFLAHNAISAGLAPTYSLVDWTQFIIVLGLSFGLAAQLPLVMTAFSYSEIIPYETFRDKWKYAILAMFGFGALFSPPDPFTQLMWAGPLVILYGFSLYLARFAASLKRGSGFGDVKRSLRTNVVALTGVFVLVGGLIMVFFTRGYEYVNQGVLPVIPRGVRPGPINPDRYLVYDGLLGAVILGVIVGGLCVLLLAMYYARPTIDDPRQFGDPTAIDIDSLDTAAIHAAPAEIFAGLSEEDVLAHARTAMNENEPDRARAILDRFDEIEELEEELDEEHADISDEPPAEEVSGGGLGGTLQRTGTGVINAFSEEEQTEDDIGGYYYDIAFVLDSLRSKAFRIFIMFITVLVSVFSFLYSGGIGAIRDDFIDRLPAIVQPEEVNIITLHPVEALVFEVKIATLLGIVATLPMLLYYAWPALSSRGLVSGDRNVFFSWTGAIFGGLLVGSAIGYLYIAPPIISYFVWDGLQADMIIAYRVSNFFWLVFFTTVGIGLLLDIIVTMVMFHRGGLIEYSSMRAHWRVVTLTVLAASAIFTPASVLSMVLVTIPIMLTYGLGLGILWLYTFGGRLFSFPAARSG